MPRAFLVKKERAQATSCCNRTPSSTNDLGFSISKITQNIDLCKQRVQSHPYRKDERGERSQREDGQRTRISPRPQSSHSPTEVTARILASRPTLKSNKCSDPVDGSEIGKDSPSWTTSLPYLGGVFGKTSSLTPPFLFNNIGTNLFIRPESTKYHHHHPYHHHHQQQQQRQHQQQQQQQEQQHHHLDDDCRSVPSSKPDVGTHPGILIPVPLSTMHPRFFPFHVSPADAHHPNLHHTSFSYPSLHHHDLHPPANNQSPGQLATRPDYLTSKFFGGFQDSLGPSPLAVAGYRSLSAWPPVSSPIPGRPTPSGSPDSPSRSSDIHRTVVQDENSGSTEKEFLSMKNFADVKRSKSNSISPTTSDSRTGSFSPPNFTDNLGLTGAVEQSNNADAEKSLAFSAHAQPEVQTYRSRPEPPPRFQCEACQKSYSTFNGLSKHKEFHCLSFVKKQFSCPHCDSKSYSSLGALKMHIRTHTLPCRCKLCGKAFSRPWLLQGHLRTHTGEKPFECPHCCRAFADRSNLRAHLQTHCDIKKYNCKTCAKTFSRMSLLLKHKENNCFGVIR